MIDKNLVEIKELEGLIFSVSDYQRGYKWGKQEVEDLLNDIYSFRTSGGGFYCLQPIVVNKHDDCFELIDGQQRLTTIFIILQVLNNELFELRYQTRESSEDFLNNVLTLPIIKEGDEQVVEAGWQDFAAKNPSQDNIDNYHFFKAYQYIQQFCGKIDKAKLLSNLLRCTKVIWYPIESSDTPETVFINFNKGKIPLEQTELIKALLVLDLKSELSEELRAFKTNQFAEDWNRIENQLQDDRFWFFISNDDSDKRRYNRINYLFDLDCGKKVKDDILFSYHQYLDTLQQKQSLALEWDRIIKLFNKLFDWYQDRNLYHILGFSIYTNIIIHEKQRGIKGVLALYDSDTIKSKADFARGIRKILKGIYNLDHEKGNYHASKLMYNTYDESKTVLLIFNIAVYELSDFNYRFPFDKLKTQKWSLEHIHAQNAEGFTTEKEFKDWQDDLEHLSDMLAQGEKKLLHQKLQAAQNDIANLNGKAFTPEIKNQLKEVTQLVDNYTQSHHISNLCLLDGKSNSALNNLRFRDKRSKILEIDGQGSVVIDAKRIKTFIPIGTKNVFLKYYSKDPNMIQFTHWGSRDRDEYLEIIRTTIKTYLK